MTRKKLLFIINPISGIKSKKSIETIIKDNVDFKKYEIEIVFSNYPKHAEKLSKERGLEFDLIVAVGGDGSINEIAKEISRVNKPLAIIPMGSGNGLARHLNIPLDVKKAVQTLGDGRLKYVDTAKLNGHFFISIAGIGFDSEVAAEYANTKSRGFITYARIAIQKYFKYKEASYDIILDNKEYKRKAFMISFANSSQFGYNTRISPKADCSDSYLDVCIVKKPKVYQIPKLLYQLWTRNADKSKHIEIIKAQKISLKQSDNEFANIDGESIQVGNFIEIDLKERDLEVMVPKNQ